MQGSEWARMRADAALPAAFLAFGHEEGSGRGRPRASWARPEAAMLIRASQGGNRGGRWERLKEGPPPNAFLRQGATDARPRRPRVRYERAGRRPYSAAAAGGAKRTPDQIAEARRLTR